MVPIPLILEQKAAKAEESLKQQVAMAANCSKKPTAQNCQSKKTHIDAETAQASGIRSGVKGKQTNDSRKGNKKASHCNDEINVNQCTICFRSYKDDIREETGEDWIECACGRWVHL